MTSNFGSRKSLGSENVCFVKVLCNTIFLVNFIEIGGVESEQHDGLTCFYPYLKQLYSYTAVLRKKVTSAKIPKMR